MRRAGAKAILIFGAALRDPLNEPSIKLNPYLSPKQPKRSFLDKS